MATGGSSSDIGINVQYGEKKVTIYVSRRDRVSSVIARLVEKFGLDKKKTYALLHEGTALPSDTTAEVAIVPARATVFFLHLAPEKVIRSSSRHFQQQESTNDLKDDKYGYCKTCKGLSPLRPIITCSTCSQSTLVLTQDNKIDFFDEESVFKARGHCTSCKTECRPRITYYCKSCEINTVPFLRLLRDNVYQIPCMKCDKKDDQIFRFTCSHQHTLCFSCFCNYCTIMLSRNKFKNFPDAGYSIACPGPDVDCPESPIPDPHHFYIVGEQGSFYNKHSEKSFEEWKPPGDNIICDKCKIEVDLSRGQEAEVPRPPAATGDAIVSGSAWFRNLKKIFSRPPPPPTPQMRKKVACFQCRQEFCCVCKTSWHEGDCVIINEEEVKEFTIQPDKALASQWPKPPETIPE